MKAIILAGGFGTRLKECVPELPKPMAPVAGKPFLAYLLDQMVTAGVDEVVLSLGHMAEVIREHYEGTYKGMPVRCVREQKPLGTGGAIVYASASFTEEAFLVVNGDTFIDLDYSSLVNWYIEQGVNTAIVLKTVADVSRYGTVEVHNNIVTGFLEKGKTGAGLINAGVYLLNPRAFVDAGLPEVFSIEQDFFQKDIESLKPAAYVTDSWFIDIGVPEDYNRAQVELPDRSTRKKVIKNDG